MIIVPLRLGSKQGSCHAQCSEPLGTTGSPTQARYSVSLQRAALSVQLNIAEGYALKGQRRFLNHLSIAYASAIEVQEILELVGDETVLPGEFSEGMLEHTQRSQRLLLGLIKRYRGGG